MTNNELIYEVEKAPHNETVDTNKIPYVGYFGSLRDNLIMWNNLFTGILQGSTAASHYRLHDEDFSENTKEIIRCAHLADVAYAELVKRSIDQ